MVSLHHIWVWCEGTAGKACSITHSARPRVFGLGFQLALPGRARRRPKRSCALHGSPSLLIGCIQMLMLRLICRGRRGLAWNVFYGSLKRAST